MQFKCQTKNGHEEVLHIPQSFSITRTSVSDCLVSYQGHLSGWGEGLILLQRNSWCILQPQLTGQMLNRITIKLFCG